MDTGRRGARRTVVMDGTGAPCSRPSASWATAGDVRGSPGRYVPSLLTASRDRRADLHHWRSLFIDVPSCSSSSTSPASTFAACCGTGHSYRRVPHADRLAGRAAGALSGATSRTVRYQQLCPGPPADGRPATHAGFGHRATTGSEQYRSGIPPDPSVDAEPGLVVWGPDSPGGCHTGRRLVELEQGCAARGHSASQPPRNRVRLQGCAVRAPCLAAPPPRERCDLRIPREGPASVTAKSHPGVLCLGASAAGLTS